MKPPTPSQIAKAERERALAVDLLHRALDRLDAEELAVLRRAVDARLDSLHPLGDAPLNLAPSPVLAVEEAPPTVEEKAEEEIPPAPKEETVEERPYRNGVLTATVRTGRWARNSPGAGPFWTYTYPDKARGVKIIYYLGRVADPESEADKKLKNTVVKAARAG